MKSLYSCVVIAAVVSVSPTLFAQCQLAPLAGSGSTGPADTYRIALHDPGTGAAFFMVKQDADFVHRVGRFDGTRWVPESGVELNNISDISSVGEELWVIGDVFDSTGTYSAVFILRGNAWQRVLFPHQSVENVTKAGDTVFATRVRDGDEVNGYAELVRWTGSTFMSASVPFPLQCRSLLSTPDGIVAAGYPLGTRTSNPGLVSISLDGSGQWTSLGCELSRRDFDSNSIQSAVYHNGSLYIGGNFELLSGVRGPVARLRSGGIWESINTGLSGEFATLLPLDGELFVSQSGAYFQQIIPTLMRLSGNVWLPALPGQASRFSFTPFIPQGSVSLLGRYQGQLAAAGAFHQAGTTPASLIATFDQVAQTWAPLTRGTSGTATSLSRWRDHTVAVGQFHGLESDRANGLAIRDDANSGWEDPIQSLTLKPVLSGFPFSKPGTFRGDLIIAGEFSAINGIAANSIARFDGTTFHPLGHGLTTPRDNTQWAGIRGTLEWNNQLIAYGTFTHADGQPTGPIAAFDGTRWNSLNTQPLHRNGDQPVILAVAEDRGNLIVVGDFTHIAGLAAPGIARYDGTTWHALPRAFSEDWLSSYGADPKFARLGDRLFLSLGAIDILMEDSPAITEWLNGVWGPLPSPGGFFSLTYHAFSFQGRFYVSGWYGGYNVLRTLDGTAWRNVNTGLDNPITDTTIDGDTLIACGYFTRTAAGPSHTLARFRCLCPADFNADQTIDMLDYLDFLSAFAAGDITSDHNSDGTVDFFDYLDFVASFASGC